MAGLRVLVVDDSPPIASLMTTTLNNLGHQVVGFAGTGAEALQKYEELRPDLVTMDIVMPDMDGIDATRQLMTLDPLAVIVMVTSQRRQSMVVKALAAGARGYITHPIDRHELADVIRMTGRYRARIVRGTLTWEEDFQNRLRVKAGLEGQPEPAPTRRMRTLVVEDSPITAKILANMLKELGHQVVDIVGTGADAIAAYRATDPDLVTMDILLPDANGLDVTRRILKEYPRALIVMVTALGQEMVVMKALAAGARGYVVQPVEKDNLREVIEMARRYRARMENGYVAWERR